MSLANCSSCDPMYNWSAYSEFSCYTYLTTGATSATTALSLVPVSSPTYGGSGLRLYSDYNLDGSPITTPLVVQSNFWTGTTYLQRPLNRSGIWTTSADPGPPLGTWVGFSQCFNISSASTYYFGVGADNNFRAVLDGNEIVNTLLNSSWSATSTPFGFWHTYPINLTAGSHVLELYGWNNDQIGSFGCEIYQNTAAQLSAATAYTQLNIILTSSGKTVADIIQDVNGNYLSSGYTCPSGYTYGCGECRKYLFCESIPPPPSCECPAPYTLSASTCIYDYSPYTGSSGSSVTFTSGDTNEYFGYLGTFFYEDVSNKVFPLTFNNNSISSPPYTTITVNAGTSCILVDGQDFTPSDVSNYYGYDDVNISGQPINIVYTSSTGNTLWCSSGSTSNGRMNNAGIKVSTGLNQWVGFTVCLEVPSTQQYHLFFGSDDIFRLKINGEWFFKRINKKQTNLLSVPTSVVGDGLVDKRDNTGIYSIFGWVNIYQVYNHIIPITLSAGTYVFEYSFTDILSGGTNFTNGTFEIYSGVTTSVLTGYTSYSQLSGSVVFSTSQLRGTTQIVPAEIGDTYGVWCDSGDTMLNWCDGSPFCRSITSTTSPCCSSIYCIYDTGTNYDNTYELGGFYDGYNYWSGQTNGSFIYFSTAYTQWCLSSSLGGDCYLSGKSPCTSDCPDLCEHYFMSGVCPTTTTTTTINCSTLDFSAIFDCEVFPTTTTTTSTSTTTTTTIAPNPCSGVSIDASITAYTTTTTTIPSTTTTTTISYNCNFSGDVTFNVIDVEVKCPVTKEFKDCTNNAIRYYTSDTLINPSGGTIEVNMVFKALVDGIERCITYVGLNYDYSNINSVVLVDYLGIYEVSNSACTICLNSTTTTTLPPTTTTTTKPPPCDCYFLITIKSSSFTYLDCNGNSQTINLPFEQDGVSYFEKMICSNNEPTCNNLIGSVTLNRGCSDYSCTLTHFTCRCYKITNNDDTFSTQIVYYDCNGIKQISDAIEIGQIYYVCSKIVPIAVLNAESVEIVVVPPPPDSEPGCCVGSGCYCGPGS